MVKWSLECVCMCNINNYVDVCRDIQENNLLLKEQNDSMKKKLDRLEDKLVSYNKLVAENEVWCRFLFHFTSFHLKVKN